MSQVNKNNYPPITKISDLVFNIDEHLQFMRENSENAGDFADYLLKYISDYFQSNEFDELQLKKIAVESVDELYLKISKFMKLDIHTDFYFGVVLNELFYKLANINVFCFFILDNQLRDDRFKLAVDLFNKCNFKSIYPYAVDVLVHSDTYSDFPIKDYSVVDSEIKNAISNKKHLIYIEKDNSVNYLNNVLAKADEIQGKYLCVFRNQGPDSNINASWLTGDISNAING